MALSNLHTVAFNYDALRLAILSKMEGSEAKPYFDIADHPTIGIGFNLDDPTVRGDVFDEMNITSIAIRNALSAIIDSPEIQALSSTGPHPTERELALRQSLNAYLSVQMGRNFEMTPTEISHVFKLEADKRERTITAQTGLQSGTIEMIAVLSTMYTGAYGTGIKNALKQDNRAEAWFELRYNSNGDGQHAKRRYEESELFGLYDSNGVSLSEAKQTFQMLGWHRDKILAYETLYSGQIAAANADLSSSAVAGESSAGFRYFGNYDSKSIETSNRFG